MGSGQYVNDTNQTMRSLVSTFEGILDSDFDVDLTLGDVVEWKPKFGVRLNSPTEYHGYSWDSKRFWAQHDTIQNAWTNDVHIATKNQIRLRHLKMDVRHGFSMALLCQPVTFKLTQTNIDKFTKQFNKEWCQPELQLEVHIKKEGDSYRLDMWNSTMTDTVNNYMCYFLITPKSMTEGLLDSDFDIKDSDLNINSVYPLTHDMYEVMVSVNERTFINAEKEFYNTNQVEPEHIVNSGYGKRHPARYFLDWIAAQPVGVLNDDQFTARKPILVTAFNDWVGSKRFSINMVKYKDEKTVYFMYNKKPILRVNFK